MFAARVDPTTAIAAAAAIPKIVLRELLDERLREERLGASSNFKISIFILLLDVRY
ncbi:unannotated protein [freshwater metagenome]|uniref:Unannotated protein n=1 Tax=freshwater metagenome TaxID=449393 RepID=A0A6J7QAW3_9ZZZZ